MIEVNIGQKSSWSFAFAMCVLVHFIVLMNFHITHYIVSSYIFPQAKLEQNAHKIKTYSNIFDSNTSAHGYLMHEEEGNDISYQDEDYGAADHSLQHGDSDSDTDDSIRYGIFNKDRVIEEQKVDEENFNDSRLWRQNVCESVQDSVCWEVFVVKNRQVTFCSAAQVASTTTKQYFYDIADGAITIPKGAKYGVHEADWVRLGYVDSAARKYILESPEWTHVFFWTNVVERFIDGYFDKVMNECPKNPADKPHLAIHHYIQYGFDCQIHLNLEAFITFMETISDFEGHFAPQTPLCNFGKFPFTDVLQVDENLQSKLQGISAKLGVEHPAENSKTSLQEADFKSKMIALFKYKPELVQRILNLYEEDCANIPEACDVTDLMTALN